MGAFVGGLAGASGFYVADAVGTGFLAGALGGAAAGLTSSVAYAAAGYDVSIGKSIGIGALAGGLGAEFGSIENLNIYAEVVGSGIIGGGMSELAGGDFATGFGFAAASSAIYNAENIAASIKDFAKSIESLINPEPFQLAQSRLRPELFPGFGGGGGGGFGGPGFRSGGGGAPKAGSFGGKGAGKAFSKNTQEQVRTQSNNTCVLCGNKTTRQPGPTRSEIDHAHPKSRGGNNSIENAQNTCRTCNRQKGTKTTEEFLLQKRE